jgi:hypothetical protein
LLLLVVTGTFLLAVAAIVVPRSACLERGCNNETLHRRRIFLADGSSSSTFMVGSMFLLVVLVFVVVWKVKLRNVLPESLLPNEVQLLLVVHMVGSC